MSQITTMIAYHGSDSKIENFNKGQRTNFSAFKEVAIQFGNDNGYLHKVELEINKIYFVDSYADVQGLESTSCDCEIEELSKLGYDAVACKDMTNIIVFDASCVKVLEIQH